uniref:Uncharacterized protein n=1 Tax=Anopheles farauti TaxID=69004 RepID=A0A182QKR2_9DIPT
MDTDRGSSTVSPSSSKLLSPPKRKKQVVGLYVNPCRRPQQQQATGNNEWRRKRRKHCTHLQPNGQRQIQSTRCGFEPNSATMETEKRQLHRGSYRERRMIAPSMVCCVGLVLLHLIVLAASSPMSIKSDYWQRVSSYVADDGIQKENFGTASPYGRTNVGVAGSCWLSIEEHFVGAGCFCSVPGMETPKRGGNEHGAEQRPSYPYENNKPPQSNETNEMPHTPHARSIRGRGHMESG